MGSIARWIDRVFYPNHGDQWDESLFREMILSRLEPEHKVLDLGAGRGRVAEMHFQGQCAFIAGVDPDAGVLSNPHVDEARQLEAPDFKIPYDDETFDIVFSDSVLEHVTDPAGYFCEVSRVLKSGGRFLAKTPNKYHYVTTIARLTPHWFHEMVNNWRGREHEDTFPTVYLCNTRRQFRQYGTGNGLELEQFRTVEGRPEYLRSNCLTYLPGIAYERVVNSCSVLEPLRCVTLAEMRKR